MSLSFPTSPVVGQIYQNWIWSGSAWNPLGGSVAPIGMKVFTANATYVPNPALVCAIVECVGGGGGGQGITSQANYAGNSGGGSGGYSRKFLMASAIGAQQTVTIGAAGAAGASGGGAGGGGGTTSFGSLCVANGGGGGGNNPTATGAGGAGAAIGVGDFAVAGGTGAGGTAVASGQGGGSSGSGAPGPFGGGAGSVYSVYGWGTGTGAINATSYGSGGSGGSVIPGIAGAGGAGFAGVCIVTEYVSTSPLILPPNTITSGNKVLLMTNVVSTSVAEVDFMYNFLANVSLYDEYEAHFFNVCASIDGTNTYLQMQVSTDGSTFDSGATAYSNTYVYTVGGSPYGGFVGAGINAVNCTYSLATTQVGAHGIVRFALPGITSPRKIFSVNSASYNIPSWGSSNVNNTCTYGGSSNPLRGIRFIVNNANITSGTFKLYGIQK